MTTDLRTRAGDEARHGSLLRARLRALSLAGAAVLTAFSLAACGSAGQPGSGASSSTAKAADTVAAQKAIAPYTGRTGAFPVTQPLGKPVPAGTRFAYLQCGAETCAIAGQLLKGAVTTLGGTLTAINSGSTSASAQAAASSVVALKPDAVILAGIDPRQYGDSLQKIADAGIKVVTISVSVPTKPFGITANYLGANTFSLAGRLLADWVIVHKGSKADVALYTVPEITLTPIMAKAFQGEMAKNCPSCSVRVVEIGVQTLGTTSPRTVVTDLQSHPKTNTAVFTAADLGAGVPAALSAAGLSPTTVVFSPNPGTLEDIKNGKITTGLGIDFVTSVWAGVDVGARLIEGGQPTASEQAGDVPLRFLAQKDITFDTTRGWNGYPDFAKRFAALWHPAG